MADIQYPSVFGSYLQGQNAGNQQRQLRETRADDATLRGLAPSIINGDPAAFSQAAAIDPKAAGQLQDAGDSQLRRLKGAINYIEQAEKTGNPQAVEAAYRQVRPYLSRSSPDGIEPPATWEEAKPRMLEAKAQIAMLDSAAPQGAVQSTFIDNQGNRVAIMRDGSTQILGQNAPNNQIIDTGNGFVGVNKGNLQAAPVVLGGAPQAPNAPAVSGANPAEDAVTSAANAMIANGVPEAQVDAWVQTQLSQPVNTLQGNSLQTGTQLRSAPKPAEMRAEQEFAAKQTRTLTPEEVARAGYRPGTIVQIDGFGNQEVRQTPPAPSAASEKAKAASTAKAPQLNAVERGVERMDKALQALGQGVVADTGPLDQYVQRYTAEGQELETAVGAIQNAMLALTRVPGIGSQSDFEAKIANLQYPSLAARPEVNARTIANLKQFVKDLRQQIEGAASNSEKTYSVGETVEHNGKVYRVVGGDPADPDLEEVE